MVMQSLLLLSASDLQAFLDTPEQLLQQSVELQLAVASYAETPRSLLDVLVNSSDEAVAEAARLHVNYAGEIVDNWQELVDEILLSRQMGQNDRLAVELLKLGAVPPCFLSEWVPAENLIQALQNPQMPLRYRLQLLDRLAQEPTLEPRLQVAESSETPMAVLEQLAGDLELPVRLAVKFNPSCPAALIELVEGQHAIASNWNEDKEQLGMLGQSRWAWIRLAVAQNPNTPQATLMELARDRVYKIQLAVAKNPGTSAEVLALLAEHENKTIQAALAEHGNITEEIIHQLFPSQQAVLRKRKNLPTSILERFFNERNTNKPLWEDYALRHLFLSHANTPTWILSELANLDLQALRTDKQANKSPSTARWEKWIQDQIRFIVEIAQHPQVSKEILERVVYYPGSLIKLAGAQNSQTPDAMRMQLFEELVLSNETSVLKTLAFNSKTPVVILEKLGVQESQLNRFHIKLQQLLTQDTNKDDREFIVEISLPQAYMYMYETIDILSQYQINLNIEEWMTLMDSYQWMTLLENYNYFGDLRGRYRVDANFQDMVNEQWQLLLPTLPDSALRKVIDNILQISDLLLDDVAQEEREIFVALVGNPSTPVALREQLQRTLTKPVAQGGYRNDDYDMRMALAYNTQIPEVERMKYLQTLILESRSYCSQSIASNPLTPLSILEQLLEQGQQEAIAKNPAVPESLLRKIADSIQPRDYILRTIAANVNTPTDLLMRFINQPDDCETNSNFSMFDVVIENPNLSIVERYRLILEKEEGKEIAKAHELMARRSNSPYVLAQTIEKGDQKAKIIAAYSQETSIQVLECLARDADEAVRSVVIENPNLPFNSLLELTQDTSVCVRASLARHRPNKKVPLQVLERLANDELVEIRAKVADHPDSSVELLRKLALDSHKDVWSALVNLGLFTSRSAYSAMTLSKITQL
jgi:Leucine rich repeat variant